MEVINRPIYLNHIVSLLDRGTMIILIGQRRVGKSFMLKQVQNWIQMNIPAANALYISKELHAFSHITNADELYKYFGGLLEKEVSHVGYGVFGADMEVTIVNDGPVTIVMDSKVLRQKKN